MSEHTSILRDKVNEMYDQLSRDRVCEPLTGHEARFRAQVLNALYVVADVLDRVETRLDGIKTAERASVASQGHSCWAVAHGGVAYLVKGENICHISSREHCHCLDQSGSWGRHETTCPLPKGCICATRTSPLCPIHGRPRTVKASESPQKRSQGCLCTRFYIDPRCPIHGRNADGRHPIEPVS